MTALQVRCENGDTLQAHFDSITNKFRLARCIAPNVHFVYGLPDGWHVVDGKYKNKIDRCPFPADSFEISQGIHLV